MRHLDEPVRSEPATEESRHKPQTTSLTGLSVVYGAADTP